MKKALTLHPTGTLLNERNKYMKKALTLLLTGALLTSMAFASPENVKATFFDGDPKGNCETLETVNISNGAVANRIHDIEDAEYVTLELNGQSYTYELISGGSNKNSIQLNVDGIDLEDEDVDLVEVREDAPTLGEVIDQLTDE